MADLFSLTDSEQAFFATGELPPDMQSEHDAAAAAEAQAAADAAAAEALAATEAEAAAAAALAASQQNQPSEVDTLRQLLAQQEQARLDLETRLNFLTNAANAPKPVTIPDPDGDPLGNMMHQLGTVSKTVQDLQARIIEQTQQREQAEQLSQFQATMRTLRDDYVKTTPDFQAAYDHLRNTRVADMRAIGIPDAHINQALLRDEVILAQNAVQQGKNPADLIYSMAKRHGYTPAVTKATQPTTQADIAAKIANLKSGTSAAKAVASGTPAADELTADSLKLASDSDLNRLVQDDKAWNKLAGGTGVDIFSH